VELKYYYVAVQYKHDKKPVEQLFNKQEPETRNWLNNCQEYREKKSGTRNRFRFFVSSSFDF